MKNIYSWGAVFRMSEKNYRKFLQAGAAGKCPDAGQYGKLVAIVQATVTDWGVEQFADALEQLDEKE